MRVSAPGFASLRVAPLLLLRPSDASASERESSVVQKKMFKVLSAIEKRDGGTFWMRVGSGFTNRDNSVNIYLDVIPKNFQLQLRELDEEDLRRRDPQRVSSGDSGLAAAAVAAAAPASGSSPDAGLPF
jgi:hypothetical protein